LAALEHYGIGCSRRDTKAAQAAFRKAKSIQESGFLGNIAPGAEGDMDPPGPCWESPALVRPARRHFFGAEGAAGGCK
jgi:hypothetical protein